MSTVLAGVRTLRSSSAWVVAVVVAPMGSMNVLVDWMSEYMNGSWRVPAVDVAPVSLTVDGMEPLMIPCLMVEGDMWVDLWWVFLMCVCLHG